MVALSVYLYMSVACCILLRQTLQHWSKLALRAHAYDYIMPYPSL